MLKRELTALDKRQLTVTPSSVPTYASACLGTARYYSACSVGMGAIVDVTASAALAAASLLT